MQVDIETEEGQTTRKSLHFNDTRWKKGHPSPNPSGRPKRHAEFRQKAIEEAFRALDVLVGIIHNPESTDTAKIQASIPIFNYAWGKPTQHVDQHTGITVQIVRPHELSDQEFVTKYRNAPMIEMSAIQGEDE